MDSIELEAKAERKRKRHMIDETPGDDVTPSTRISARKHNDDLETERSDLSDRMKRRLERRKNGRQLLDALTVGGESAATPSGGPDFAPQRDYDEVATEPQDMPVAYQHSTTWKNTPDVNDVFDGEQPLAKKWESTPAGPLSSQRRTPIGKLDDLLEIPSESEHSYRAHLSQVASANEFKEMPAEK